MHPRTLTRCSILPLIVVSSSVRGAEPSSLQILGNDFPKAFFFRASEGAPRRPATDYAAWDAEFSRLMGIMGKCLDEEVPGTEGNNPEFFTRFKERHPQQVVLLHFNGNARDPRHAGTGYFAGHWIYRRATRILSDLPAEKGEATIRVEDARDFRVDTGRYKSVNDDVALFGLGADGRHDWGHSEQTQLVSVDYDKNEIRVRRGCYGTRPLGFTAGNARAAAHQVEGPWGRKSHLLWYYNFATHCPEDSSGLTAADVLIEDFVGWFEEGGKLAALDGLEFDVMFHETHGDTDGDGVIDDGVVNGVNQYGIGVVEFARALRARLGPTRIIQGDGALGAGGLRSQRCWTILNGIESEGFPDLRDWEFEDWSGGLNRHLFWNANAHEPAFSYINHKWTRPIPGKPGARENVDVPFSRHRLALAASVLTDAMVCYSFAPPRGNDRLIGIWDELCCGSEHRLGWLGSAEGPAIRLAGRAPDALDAAGKPPGTALAQRVRGAVRHRVVPGGLELAPGNTSRDTVSFTIPDLTVAGRDLVLLATIKGRARKGYPAEMARAGRVGVTGGPRSLVTRDLPPTGMTIRGKGETDIARETGALLRFVSRATIGERTIPAYFAHPPYKGVKGAVWWFRDVDLPRDAELRFAIGMGPKSPGRSDGVWFRVEAADLSTNGTGAFVRLFEESLEEHAWKQHSVSLAALAGRRVRLRFVADCGPRDDATTDHAYWGDVRIARKGFDARRITEPKAYMTWVNEKPFRAVFYFRDVRSPTVDLTFEFEGSEPVTLVELSAHCHADAMARLFEHGIVLANPALEPYTFDLDALSPERRYRRLLATPRQDTQVNNGKPVRGTVTLGERDALFLVREQ